MRDYSKMQFVESIDVKVRDESWIYSNSANADYSLDYYWIFSACDEEYGNNHTLCPVDFKFREKYYGHCVCGCHKDPEDKTFPRSY